MTTTRHHRRTACSASPVKITASFDPQPGTIHGTVPGDTASATTEILAEEDSIRQLARWDTPRVATRPSCRQLRSTGRSSRTPIRVPVSGLTLGRYTLSTHCQGR
ncbi:hypothetical protein KCP69_13970 [Salmonella enterica subsp. enterica]|nr:hypothetical protein KCP69_13970 [Salmonella enterica subsp. enterica]